MRASLRTTCTLKVSVRSHNHILALGASVRPYKITILYDIYGLIKSVTVLDQSLQLQSISVVKIHVGIITYSPPFPANLTFVASIVKT